MGEFKVVYRCSAEDGIDQAKDLNWEHGCPLLLSALQISRDTETGQAFLQAKVQNISAKDIASFKVSFEIMLRNGEKEEHVVRPLDADVVAGARYQIKPILLNEGDVLSAKGKIEYLSFTDGEEWKSSSEPKFLPVRKKMHFTSVKVFEERQVLLRERGCGHFKKAAPYATNKGDGWIQCSCGQLNVGLDNCLSCGLFFSDIDLLEDEENLKALAEERAARKQKEEAEKAEQKRIDAEKRAEKIEKIKSFPAKIGHGIKKEYGSHKRKKSPNKKIIVGLLVVVVVLLVGVLFATKTICFHQWQDATCTKPKTCTLCQRTDGEPLGHKEGDWSAEKLDVIDAKYEKEKKCIRCRASLDYDERDITSFVKNGKFIFSGSDFLERFEDRSSIVGSDLKAKSGLATNGTTYKITLEVNSKEIGAGEFFESDDSKMPILMAMSGSENYFRKISFTFKDSLDEKTIQQVLSSLMSTVDPSANPLFANEKSSNCIKEINEETKKSEFKEHGILYTVEHLGDWSITIKNAN